MMSAKRVFFFSLIFSLSSPILSDRLMATSEEAIRAYQEAEQVEDRDLRLEAFAGATRYFREAIANNSPNNADLWTNLGITALQAEQLGTAIHAYRSALRLDPDHRRASGNLLHARSFLPGWVPRPEEGGALDTFLFWHRRLSPAERGLIASVCFLLACISLALGLDQKRSWLRLFAVIPFAAWIALLATTPDFDAPSESGVVIVEDTVGRAADSPRASVKFNDPLPAGVEVVILEEREEWRRIGLSDGREAWVPHSSVLRLGELPR